MLFSAGCVILVLWAFDILSFTLVAETIAGAFRGLWDLLDALTMQLDAAGQDLFGANDSSLKALHFIVPLTILAGSMCVVTYVAHTAWPTLMKSRSRKLSEYGDNGISSDTEFSEFHPPGLIFVSNPMTMAEVERCKQVTTRLALQELFRTSDWRDHIRRRGRDEANYNWQLRKSLRDESESGSDDVEELNF